MSATRITRRTTLMGMAAIPLFAHADVAWAQATAGSNPPHGGTIDVAFYGEPLTLVALSSLQAPFFSAKTTEGLLYYDHDMVPHGQLAASWEVSPDGLKYTFKLREGVKWHDGKPFTSADVAKSVELWKTVHVRARQVFGGVTEVQTPDDHTVSLVLEKPVPYLLKAFAAVEAPVLPKHIYDGVDATKSENNSAPIGTGPFRFKEWVRGSHVIFERNPDYWDAPRPYVDQLIVRFMPEANARAIALETGASNLGYRTPVSLSDLRRLRADAKLAFETRGYEYSGNITSMTFNRDNKYLADIKVRQALAHAIDRDAMVKIVFYGESTPCASPIIPKLKAYHTTEPTPYPFDIEKAKQLLDEAGLKPGANGIRFNFTLDVMPLQGEPKRLSEFIRGSMLKIGVGVDLRTEDSGSYVRRVYTERDFDATLAEYSNLYDPIAGVRRLYWSKNIVKGLPFSNSADYRNPRVDELLEAATVEQDEAKRKEMFLEFQKIVMTELPDINLCMPNWVTIHDPKLKDHSVTADGVEGNLAYAYFEA